MVKPTSNGAQIHVDGQGLPRRIFLILLLIEISLVVLDAVVNYGRLIDVGPVRRLFNIAREDGLATWFMVTQTFMAGLVLWLIFLVQRNHSASRGNTMAWGFLAIFFIYMAADDGAEIHERLGSTFKALYPAGQSAPNGALLNQWQGIFPSYDWQLVVLPLLAGAGLFMVFFLHRELRDRGARVTLYLAVSIMIAAVGLDFIEGLDHQHAWNVQVWIVENFRISADTVRHFSKSLEEFLEMASMSLLLSLFIYHLIQKVRPRLTIMLR